MLCNTEPPTGSALAVSVELNLASLYISRTMCHRLHFITDQPTKLQVLRHHGVITRYTLGVMPDADL